MKRESKLNSSYDYAKFHTKRSFTFYHFRPRFTSARDEAVRFFCEESLLIDTSISSLCSRAREGRAFLLVKRLRFSSLTSAEFGSGVVTAAAGLLMDLSGLFPGVLYSLDFSEAKVTDLASTTSWIDFSH